MNEKSYKVYLTRSREVAALIYDTHRLGEDEVIGTSYGSAEGQEAIPPIYSGKGYYYCVVTRRADVPSYELIIA